jgi:hypothetical protein
MALIVVGGFVPLMTFYVERKVVREARGLGQGAKAEVNA